MFTQEASSERWEQRTPEERKTAHAQQEKAITQQPIDSKREIEALDNNNKNNKKTLDKCALLCYNRTGTLLRAAGAC